MTASTPSPSPHRVESDDGRIADLDARLAGRILRLAKVAARYDAATFAPPRLTRRDLRPARRPRRGRSFRAG